MCPVHVAISVAPAASGTSKLATDPTEPHAGFWTAGMSHSFVDDSLLKNPVSPFILPTSGGSEEKEDELEDVQEDE